MTRNKDRPGQSKGWVKFKKKYRPRQRNEEGKKRAMRIAHRDRGKGCIGAGQIKTFEKEQSCRKNEKKFETRGTTHRGKTRNYKLRQIKNRD